MKTVTAADANRYFSKLLREVQEGEAVTITSRGKPVATLQPINGGDDAEKLRKQEAWRDFLEHLRTRPSLNIPITWTRDDVYDDDF